MQKDITPTDFQKFCRGWFYLFLITRVKTKASTITNIPRNNPYTILPFSICSTVGKASNDPQINKKTSITIMIARIIEITIQIAFFIYFTPFIASFAFVLQRCKQRWHRAKPIPLKMHVSLGSPLGRAPAVAGERVVVATICPLRRLRRHLSQWERPFVSPIIPQIGRENKSDIPTSSE